METDVILEPRVVSMRLRRIIMGSSNSNRWYPCLIIIIIIITIIDLFCEFMGHVLEVFHNSKLTSISSSTTTTTIIITTTILILRMIILRTIIIISIIISRIIIISSSSSSTSDTSSITIDIEKFFIEFYGSIENVVVSS